jgi:hypothetical protein
MSPIEMMPIVLGVTFFIMVTLVVLISARARQNIALGRADLHAKMIDRFGSAPEFLEFIQSNAGREMLGLEKGAAQLAAHERIIATFRRAVIVGSVGIGFLLCCISPEVSNAFFIVVGCILLSLGAGFAISAFVSLKLLRQWGSVAPASQIVRYDETPVS